MSEIKVSNQTSKTSIGSPSDQYDSMRDVWAKCRAIIRGQESTKAHDEFVNDYDDRGNMKNILLPFSPSMTQNQYDFYKGEAELPGITSQYARSMIGALLRKDATLVLPERMTDDAKEEVENWLRFNLTSDNKSMFHFLDDALWEEMQSGYGWIYVDVPEVDEGAYETFTEEQKARVKPYPTLITSDKVINVIHGTHPITKTPSMMRFITRYFTNTYNDNNPWHPVRVDTVRDHYIDESGFFRIDEYRAENSGTTVSVENGGIINEGLTEGSQGNEAHGFKFFKTFEPKRFGERLDIIPAWPLDGEYNIEEPPMLTFVNREIGLYNKISRRNHLMYGAATYTPVVIGIEDEEKQQGIVDAGLGSWLFLDKECTVDTLAPPTDSLNDMQTAIESTIEEMAKMGIRMLTPETSQSGVALELRNSSQTASLGTLNIKVSTTLRQIFAFMINWRFNFDITPDEIDFNMSSDFSPQAQGELGMRLVGEWYQNGLIPRSVFIDVAKKNDYLAADYNDEEGIEELENDPVRQASLEAMNPTIME